MAKLSVLDTVSRGEQGVDMMVRDAKGAIVEGMTIKLAGSDSDRVQKIYDKNWDSRRNMGGRRSVLPSGAEARADRIEAAVVATLGWAGFEDDDGNTIDCTPEAARAAYRRFPDLLRQVIAFMEDGANFAPASTTN